MYTDQGIAGMRKVFSHRYTEHGKVAFNTFIELIQRNVFLPFAFDEITSYSGCVGANKGMRAIAFINRAKHVSLAVFMKPVRLTWVVFFVELNTSEGEKYFEKKIGSGVWAEFQMLTEENVRNLRAVSFP